MNRYKKELIKCIDIKYKGRSDKITNKIIKLCVKKDVFNKMVKNISVNVNGFRPFTSKEMLYRIIMQFGDKEILYGKNYFYSSGVIPVYLTQYYFCIPNEEYILDLLDKYSVLL